MKVVLSNSLTSVVIENVVRVQKSEDQNKVVLTIEEHGKAKEYKEFQDITFMTVETVEQEYVFEEPPFYNL